MCDTDKGLISHVKKLEFYLKYNAKCSMQDNEMTWFTFLKNHSGYCVEKEM